MTTDVIRAKTATGDWCKPTKEVPNGDLAQLIHRTRRESEVVLLGEGDRKAVPELTDPWFQDSQPIEIDETAMIVDRPPVEPPAPPVLPVPRHGEVSTAPRGRHPREAIRRISSGLARLTAPRAVTYPTAPASYVWVWPLLLAVVAAITVGMAIARPF